MAWRTLVYTNVHNVVLNLMIIMSSSLLLCSINVQRKLLKWKQINYFTQIYVCIYVVSRRTYSKEITCVLYFSGLRTEICTHSPHPALCCRRGKEGVVTLIPSKCLRPYYHLRIFGMQTKALPSSNPNLPQQFFLVSN